MADDMAAASSTAAAAAAADAWAASSLDVNSTERQQQHVKHSIGKIPLQIPNTRHLTA
jgi:hypothetical protein